MSSKNDTKRPEGIPEGAVEVSLDQLETIAANDPTFRPLLEQVKAARSTAATNAVNKGNSSQTVKEAVSSGISTVGSSDGSVKRGDRLKVQIDGREIYQWQQTLEEITIYVKRPAGVAAKMIGCEIDVKHLTLGIGLKTKTPEKYFDDDLGGEVLLDQSFMTIEDDSIVIYLQKAHIGELWKSALAAHAHVSTGSELQAREQLMLERFQREHPGFDFSNATFSGNVPDTRKFMGGIDETKIR